MAQIPGVYNPTDEWLQEHLSGWIEKREDDKALATLRAHFRVIGSPEDKQILAHEYYDKTTEKDFSKKSKEAVFYKAIHKDIFQSNLALLSQSLVPSNVMMEVMLHFPNYQSELMFLAKVTQVEADNELGRVVYHAYLKGLAVNQRSLTKLIHAMTRKKDLV